MAGLKKKVRDLGVLDNHHPYCVERYNGFRNDRHIDWYCLCGILELYDQWRKRNERIS